MSILQTIIQLDSEYDDEGVVIDVFGTLPDGREVDLWIHKDEDGQPRLYPGASFLPYYGIYFNPLIVSIRECAE